MHIFAQAFWLPKAGNSIEEYEDAFWPELKIDQCAEAFKFAVADGATTTSFSGLWARMLVRAYCEGQLAQTKLSKFLPDLQKEWFEQIGKKPLPWYAEEQLRRGAFSSLIGLTLKEFIFNEKQRYKWEAMAIGDSCLFQVRGGRLIHPFPLVRSEEFNNRPYLLSSNPSSNNHLKENVVRRKGAWESGDEFYLMTDALACWFLKSIEENDNPRELLRDIVTSDQFADLITELRKSRVIGNDDVTLLRIDT